MAIKNIIPRNSGEGGLGIIDQAWGQGVFDSGIFHKNIFVDGSGVFKQDLFINGSGITELISSKATGDISGHLEGIRDNIFNTGAELELRINDTGYILSQAIRQTGYLIDNTYNNIARTGNILEVRVSNLSGDLLETGSYLLNVKTSNLSGSLIDTGNYLDSSIGFLSGDLIDTGNYLDSNIGFLSGDLIDTGNYLESIISTGSGANIIPTGNYLESNILSLSGDLIDTGNYLESIISTGGGGKNPRFENIYVSETGNFNDIKTSGELTIGTGDLCGLIFSGDKLGINTCAPEVELDVYGDFHAGTGSECGLIFSGDKLGINTCAPEVELDVNGDVYIGTGSGCGLIFSGDKLGINTCNPEVELHVSGNIRAESIDVTNFNLWNNRQNSWSPSSIFIPKYGGVLIKGNTPQWKGSYQITPTRESQGVYGLKFQHTYGDPKDYQVSCTIMDHASAFAPQYRPVLDVTRYQTGIILSTDMSNGNLSDHGDITVLIYEFENIPTPTPSPTPPPSPTPTPTPTSTSDLLNGQIQVIDTEANILTSNHPTNTIAFSSDTKKIFIYNGSNWINYP